MNLPELSFDSKTTSLPELNFGAADNTPEMKDTQFGVEHPYLRALQNTASQAVFNPIYQAVNSLAPAIKGIQSDIGYNPKNLGLHLGNFTPPDMSNAPFAAKVLGDVAGGVGKGAAAFIIGGGNPFLGYGALSGLEAQGKGQNPILPAITGAASAIPQAVGGYVGGKLASSIFNPIANQVFKYAPNIGTALGMGGVSAAQAPSGQKLENFATGATFGTMSPMGGPKNMTQAEFDQHTSQLGDIYRKILNPGKGIINKVEVKGGGDIDQSTQLAAKLGLIINRDQTNKLDTTDARNQVQKAIQPLHQQLNNILSSNPSAQFDLNDLRQKAITSAKTNPAFKNAQEYEQGVNSINNLIDAEIRQNGDNPFVNGEKLNNIKEGMWSVGYNDGAPNNFYASRLLGNQIKNDIETHYNEDGNIKALNQERGKYLQLDNLLAKSHGQVVQGGKLGQHFARILGAMGGFGLSNIPGLSDIPGVKEGGWAAGAFAGGKINDFLNDPQRLTTALSKGLKNINITDKSTQNPFVSPKQTNTTPLDEIARMEDEGGGSSLSPDLQKPIPDDVKSKAKEHVNQYWLGQLNPLNPLNKNLKAAVPAAALAGGLMFGQAQAQEPKFNIDISKINQIESSGIGDRIGDNGKAFGINQIHLPVLQEFNQHTGNSFTQDDLMHVGKNNQVADWYYNKRIPQMLKAYKIPDSVENRISAYNYGIGNTVKSFRQKLQLPKTTKEYIRKYNS